MPKAQDLLQGTLDMLILKAVSLGPLHGYGVLLRIQQISGERLQIQQGSLYPALYRLEHQGLIKQRMGRVGQQAQGEVLLADGGQGRRRFQEQTQNWEQMADIIATVLKASPDEL